MPVQSPDAPENGINWTPSLTIRAKNFTTRNLRLSTSDLRSLYNWSGNHTHDQSFGHFGHQEARRRCGDTLPAYRRPGEALLARIRTPIEESRCSSSPTSLPSSQGAGLIGSSFEEEEDHWSTSSDESPSDDGVVQSQDPVTPTANHHHHPLPPPEECEVDIEVGLEMTSTSSRITTTTTTTESMPQRVANMGGDGIDLVEWGDGRAEHRPRSGGDFFHPGRVVNPFSGNNDELDRRTLVVLSTTNNGYAECLALCRHPDHSGEERANFYNAHAAVYSSGEPPPPPPPASTCDGEMGRRKRTNEAIEIRFKSPRFRMQDSCYVNFEHTWTIRPDFPVMDLGYVRKDQRRRLMEMHAEIQVDLFNRNIKEHGLGEKLKLS
ncbi:hypothetical protein VMCG_09744 [Cytospora schulzeri]|uniref:DUF6590 domain-containing protein n=1 Tax=Cytospora schulzeri TaxID=448051 RepID=A0A423VHA0_9PEZI|nr:hypothetical protein VMCG_09744 [Valsa malicola]